jgi:hypothetical protein
MAPFTTGLRFCNQWRHETNAGGAAATDVCGAAIGVEAADAEGVVDAAVSRGGGVEEEELMIGSGPRLVL